VILAVKSHHLPKVAARAPPLVHQDTALLNTQNGMPWWCFHDALLDAVVELGELTGTPAPCRKMVNARVTLPDKTLQDTSACLRA
jgi:ketopantoate reductase